MLLPAPDRVIYIWPGLLSVLDKTEQLCWQIKRRIFQREEEKYQHFSKSASLDEWFCYGCYGGLEGIIFSLINNNNTQPKSKILQNQLTVKLYERRIWLKIERKIFGGLEEREVSVN